jgi:hypothetical protein
MRIETAAAGLRISNRDDIGNASVEEKREYMRVEIEKPAKLSFDGTTLSCLIRNLSESGAAIDIENAAYLPARFRLTMLPDRTVRDCRLVWIKTNRIGVAFESAGCGEKT